MENDQNVAKNHSDADVDEADGLMASCCIKGNREEEDPIDAYHKRFNEEVVISKTSKNDIYYSMDYPKKGLLLIFAHSTYTVPDLKERYPQKDVESLQRTFSNLNFDIDPPYMNKTLKEIKKIIREVSSRNFEDYASLVIAVSTHGSYKELLAKDASYDPEKEFYDHFKKVKSLFGKPKIFLLGACRGEGVDRGVKMLSVLQTDGAELEEYRTPEQADILLVYATVLGYVAYSNKKYGSHFFRYLTEAIDEFPDENMVSIISLANFKLSHFTTYSAEPEWDGNKQCISYVSTLTRLLHYNK